MAGSLPPFTVRALLPQLLKSNAAVVTAVTVGDVGCQATEGHFAADGAGWDAARTGRMVVAAFFATGPLSFFWNQFLERRLPGRQLKQVFSKMLANGLFAPVQITTSFTAITLLSGRSFKDARRKVQQDLPFTFMVGTAYWPFVGFVQFRFVPLAYRPVVGSIAGATYNMFFSSMANRPVDPAAVHVPAAGPAPVAVDTVPRASGPAEERLPPPPAADLVDGGANNVDAVRHADAVEPDEPSDAWVPNAPLPS